MLACGYRGSSSPGWLLLHVCVCVCSLVLAHQSGGVWPSDSLPLQHWAFAVAESKHAVQWRSRPHLQGWEQQLILLGEAATARHAASLKLLWARRQAHQMSGAWLQINNSWCGGQDKILCISVMGLGCLCVLAWEKEVAHLSERQGYKLSEDLGWHWFASFMPFVVQL